MEKKPNPNRTGTNRKYYCTETKTTKQNSDSPSSPELRWLLCFCLWYLCPLYDICTKKKQTPEMKNKLNDYTKLNYFQSGSISSISIQIFLSIYPSSHPSFHPSCHSFSACVSSGPTVLLNEYLTWINSHLSVCPLISSALLLARVWTLKLDSTKTA